MQIRVRRFVASVSVAIMVGAVSVSQASANGSSNDAVRGRLSIVHGDGPDKHAVHKQGALPDHVLPDMHYWLETDSGRNVLLEFPGHPPKASPNGYYVARGRDQGRSFRVAEMRTASAPGGGGGGGKPQPVTPSFVGPRDMIVIPFTFKGSSKTHSFTPQQIRDAGFTGAISVNSYYQEGSSTTDPSNPVILKGKNDGATAAPFDKDALPGDVAVSPAGKPYEIVGSTTTCDYRTWAANARSAATADGWDLGGYEHIVYIHPDIESCSWEGLGEVGGDESWLNDNIWVGVWAHELGHNLTLYHARTLICGDSEVFFSVARSGCSFDEYGDPFDTMGDVNTPRHFGGRNKAHMSWFPIANVVTGAPGGTYTLSALETKAVGPQLLQIARGKSEYVYVDFRQPYGAFDTYSPAADAVTGAMIRIGPAIPNSGHSWLIDTSMFPYAWDQDQKPTPDFLDAALQPGEGWIDTVSGIYIETIEVAGGTIKVLVKTNQSNVAPLVAVSNQLGPILVGAPHQAPSATATDSNKNLGMFRWSWSSCPTECPALVGQTEGALAGGNDSISGPSYVPTTPGSYVLRLSTWDTAGAKTTTLITERAGL